MPLSLPPLSLRTRLGLWAALATGLAVLLVSAGLYFSVSGLIQRGQFDRAQAAAGIAQNRVEGMLRRKNDDMFGRNSSDQIQVSADDLETIARSADMRGIVELRLSNSRSNDSRSNNRSQNQQPSSVHTAHFPSNIPETLSVGQYKFQDYLVLARPLRGTPGALLTIAADVQATQEARRAFGRVLAWLLPLALLLALGMGWLVAGRLLRPVALLEGAARDMGEGGDLRRPLPGAGTQDELSRLALALQDSYGRLADAREREQGFLRAAAHDLRSPLAALQARVDGTLARERDPERYRQDLREMGQDITRLSTLANHLLLLARDPGAMAHAPVPLRELAAEAVDRARELAPLADVDLDAPQAITIQGDRVLLGQAIWNLTMNAVKYAPEATIVVQVRAGSQGGAEIRVTDDGPGVSPEVLARLGEAFYRPDSSRTRDEQNVGGHGLGLALAQRAAHLHGGQLVLSSRPGQGFSASIILPAPQSSLPGLLP